jgi:serine phosphatase RsbU (regulator of sigma subunit)
VSAETDAATESPVRGRPYVVATSDDVTDAEAARRSERDLATAEEGRRRATAQVIQLSAVALDVVRAETVHDLERIVIGRGLQVLGAHGGAVCVRDDDERVVRLATSDNLGEQAQLEYAVLPLDSSLPAAYVARTGEEVLPPTRASGAAWAPETENVYRITELAAWATLPLQVSGRLLGALVVGWRDERELTGDELALLRGFAAMCAQALHRIQGLQADRQVAHANQELSETLQRSLLTQPPTPDALNIAVRYQPAQEAAQVGGDWYDAFVTASGTTMLVVGDVSGHDQIAAATMGQVRNVLRGLAFDSDDGPADLLRRLDEALHGLELDTLATAVLARVEQPADYAADGRRRLRWTNAGHLPPLLREPDGTVRRLEHRPDLLLGLVRGTERAEHTVDLAPGSTLLLYTDGLVERRDLGLDESIDALMDSFSKMGNRKPDEICDAILDAMGAEAGDDDVAMLVLRCDEE